LERTGCTQVQIAETDAVGGSMKREVAAEIVDALNQAGVDFVATLTEAKKGSGSELNS
jgi:hypothetical protein